MIATLQWTTLGVCCFVTLARVPSVLRGENRSLFAIFAFMTLAILLSIDAPYGAVDQVLGGVNIANVLLRFIISPASFSWDSGWPGASARTTPCGSSPVLLELR